MGFSPRTETCWTARGVVRARGARLTELRREVLGLILDADGARRAPTTCSTACAARRGGGAPPTVYRALDFLQEQGFVHKLERLSAFVGCVAHEQ